MRASTGFWSATTGQCNAAPPIACGENTPSPQGNNALCLHLIVNTTNKQTWKYVNDSGSVNQTVVVPPPPSFQAEAWWSFEDGEAGGFLKPFRYCVQLFAGADEIAV